LIFAACAGHPNVVEWLLGQGADPAKGAPKGIYDGTTTEARQKEWTASACAARYEYQDLAALLKNAYAPPRNPPPIH
jgi:hypothetical protein